MKREATLRGRKHTKKSYGRRWDGRRQRREARAQAAAGRRWTHERRGRARTKRGWGDAVSPALIQSRTDGGVNR